MTKMYWLKWDRLPWKENDIITKFVGTICTNEEKTEFLNIRNKYIKVVILIDYSSKELMSKVVTTTEDEGSFEFLFTQEESQPLGEWKIEVYGLDKDGEIIGMTHHDDFNVEP